MASESNKRVRGNEIGTTGAVVAFNVRRLRRHAGFDLRTLSHRLADAGRPISASGLSKIENLEKRVEVDDLMALAVVLGVNPNALLLNPTLVSNHYVRITGRQRQVSANDAWAWARGDQPLDYASAHRGQDLSEVDIEDFRARLKESFADRTSPGYPADPGPGVSRWVSDREATDTQGYHVSSLEDVETEDV